MLAALRYKALFESVSIRVLSSKLIAITERYPRPLGRLKNSSISAPSPKGTLQHEHLPGNS